MNLRLIVTVESEPHTEDLRGMLLTRPYPNEGAFLIQTRLDDLPWAELKGLGVLRYYSEEDLEQFDMFQASPGWRYGVTALRWLLTHGYTLVIDGVEVTTPDQLAAHFTADAKHARRTAAERAYREERERQTLFDQLRTGMWYVAINHDRRYETPSLPFFPFAEATYQGNRHEPLDLHGIWFQFHDGFDLTRGNGFEFCVVGDQIWLVENKANTDRGYYDLDHANIQLGARQMFAMGLGVCWPATPERLSYLQTLPTAPSLRERCYRIAIGDRVEESIWGLQDTEGPQQPTRDRPIVWVMTLGSVYLGIEMDQTVCWLAVGCSARNVQSSEVGTGSLDNQSVAMFRYPATPERLAAFHVETPSWFGTDQVGRYLLKTSTAFCMTNALDAAFQAIRWNMPLNRIIVTPGVTLVRAGEEKTGYQTLGLQLWSDHKITRGTLTSFQAIAVRYAQAWPGAPLLPEPPEIPPYETFAAAGVALAMIARRSPAFKPDGWRDLLEAVHVEKAPATEVASGVSGSWSWETWIRQCTVQFADRTEILWLAGYQGGGMSAGGDGETDDDSALCLSEGEARAWCVTIQQQLR